MSLRPFMDARLFTIYNQPGNTVQKIRWTISGLVDRVGSIVSANQYDAILIHKEAFPFGPPWLENALQKRVSCLIYDMDDAFWTHPPQFHQIGSRFRDPNRIAKMIGMSDHVLAGNEFLANYATNYNSAVTIFPTVLDTDRYLPRIEAEDEKVTIGWVGRWSSEAYLHKLIPVFQILNQRYANIEFNFVGGMPDSFPPGLPVKLIPWRLESEIEDLCTFDIGIMPLPDDEYSRGKCGFKLLQYMALGIPAVASPVGVNNHIVREGINGLLAKNEGEWVEKLSQLIESKSNRYEIGNHGRVTVEENYSLAKAFPILLNLLNSYSGS